MKHRSNILTRMLSVTLAVSMLFDANGMTALAESADALSGADSYAVEAEAAAAEDTSGVAGEALPGAVESAEGSHIGIRNVRARIEKLCGGTLTIESRLGEGTAVTIRIPKREARV